MPLTADEPYRHPLIRFGLSVALTPANVGSVRFHAALTTRQLTGCKGLRLLSAGGHFPS
jgi:hypothetical protein